MNKQAILAAIDATAAAAGAAYADTLRGPRTRGSTTGKGLEALPEDFVARECYYQDDAGKGVVILRGETDALEGQLGVVSLKQALTDGYPVSVREGDHGLELFIDQDDVDLIRTNVLTFLVSNEDHDEVPAGCLITWYPGESAPKLQLTGREAVKLHNG
jgi:hypothetical protein